MEAALFTFGAVFLLLASIGSLLVYQRGTRRRLARAVAQTAASDFLLAARAERPGAKLASFVERFQRLLPRSPAEVSVMQKRLIRAGYREKKYVNILYGAKVLTPLLLCLVVAVTGAYAYGGFFVYIMALGFGFLAPDFWLGHRIKTRQTNLRLGLPDALDLIVICVEAGLGVGLGRFCARPKNCA